MAKGWQYVLVGALAITPIYFEALPGIFSALVLGVASLLVPYLIATFRLGHREALRYLLVGGSVALGVFSVATGYLNFLTDEWATPQYVTLLFSGHNWYSTPFQFQYVKMGTVYNTTIWDVYLPLLPFIQVPYVWLDYRWFTLAVWGLMVYVVRGRYYTSMALGGQYMALMAANGFNDVIPLLFLTLAFVTLSGRRARLARYLSLGMKQFSNAFVFGYQILRRDWREAGITIAISLLFLVPFFVWDWKSAICTPILDMPPDCSSTQNLGFNSVHVLINFALWPVWIAGVYYRDILVLSKRLSRRFGIFQ
jgi:hypothetical protein